MSDADLSGIRARSFWPDKCEGAVSLSFDDAAPTHREIAIPLLDRYDLPGTFYVPTGGSGWLDHIPFWRNAAARGHEIGNHSVNHPCSRNFDFVSPGNDIESFSMDRYEAEVLEATANIRQAIPDQTVFSYCYPCYHSWIGSGATRESIVPVVARHFPAGRGGGERPNHPEHCELEYLWACDASGWTTEQLVSYAEEAVDQGRWSVFCFHGVGGDHISVDDKAFEGLLSHLAEQKDRIWTDTVVNVAISILKKRADLKT
ncbi:MAG: polysaccharide deacetylase family protein [Candidatus Latescibacteria bacterium]|jgi:peptidoglycan-N-acetylglucosamine deacetylase|nr:polysaccharide deacetylase family protein [Candidatus Latescibacterota bacterium]